MVFFSKLDRSADLVKGMATRIGYDVSDPAHAPLFKQMVFACAGCSDQEGCARLQADADTLDAAPTYCRNADRFAAE